MKKALFCVLFIGLTFFAYGQFEYFEWENGSVIITGYNGSAKSIVIPEKINGLLVTSIGYGAFQDNQLTSVTIPNSVTSIGEEAFAVNELTSVTIPNSVTSIGYGAFWRNQLTSVTIPNSVTSIGEEAFQSNQLTSVTIPNSVTSIESSAFGNNSVKGSKEPFSVMVYKNAVTITGYNREETTVVIPEEINGLPVTTIGDSAFSSNQLTRVTIPNSVTAIGEQAFSENQLTNVTIPNSVTTIGQGAFYRNQLTSVTIPNSVTINSVTTESWWQPDPSFDYGVQIIRK